jgi:hypothetical protein
MAFESSRLIEDAEKLTKIRDMDLSAGGGLIMAIMNLISIEEHL